LLGCGPAWLCRSLPQWLVEAITLIYLSKATQFYFILLRAGLHRGLGRSGIHKWLYVLCLLFDCWCVVQHDCAGPCHSDWWKLLPWFIYIRSPRFLILLCAGLGGLGHSGIHKWLYVLCLLFDCWGVVQHDCAGPCHSDWWKLLPWFIYPRYPGFLFHCVLVSLGDLGIQEYISDCRYCVCFLIAKVWSSMTVQVLVTVIGGIMNYGVWCQSHRS